jgi:hypothetical protein
MPILECASHRRRCLARGDQTDWSTETVRLESREQKCAGLDGGDRRGGQVTQAGMKDVQ